jgi:hypothetical protein
LWENMAEPIMTGREELGFSKIYCELPDPRVLGGESHCEASWQGFRFMDLTTKGMRQLTADEITRRPGGGGNERLHLKYIPRTGEWGQADAAYVTADRAGESHAVIQEIWAGEGEVTFHRARWEDMPTQYMIVNALAELEIEEYLGATMTRLVGGKDLSDQHVLR